MEHHSSLVSATKCEPREPNERLALWTLADGRRVLLRPLGAQDTEHFGRWIASLSANSRRQRFHAACNSVSGARLVQMTQVDHRRHVAFALLHLHAGQETLVGEARYRRCAAGVSAEFALLIDDQWQGLGLGRHALRTLILCAAQQGLQRLHGQVQRSNMVMRRLARRCGFSFTPEGSEPQLLRMEIEVPWALSLMGERGDQRVGWGQGRLGTHPAFARAEFAMPAAAFMSNV
jgi:RimJ/RimL family protein N-acetyltransferase